MNLSLKFKSKYIFKKLPRLYQGIFSILLSRRTGNHPQEEWATFSQRSESKVGFFEIPA
jgi:hypothetical protein